MPDFDPTLPCPHMPGTAAKVEWMRRRALLRLPLFRAEDVGSSRTRRRLNALVHRCLLTC